MTLTTLDHPRPCFFSELNLPGVGVLKILIVQSATDGTYSALDAHCHHMGASLVEADIEELPTGNCLVCPWHKKKIDIRTGYVVDTDLSGQLCLSHSQQQRTYDVHHDDEHIFVSIPAFSKELPSDRWNPRGANSERAGYGLASNAGYGLNATVSQPQVPPGSPLQPFAGNRGWPAGSPAPMVVDDEVVVGGSQQSPTAASAAQPRRLDFGGGGGGGGSVGFGASRRNRAATEAIMKKAYQPPSSGGRAVGGGVGGGGQRSIRDFFG